MPLPTHIHSHIFFLYLPRCTTRHIPLFAKRAKALQNKMQNVFLLTSQGAISLLHWLRDIRKRKQPIRLLTVNFCEAAVCYIISTTFLDFDIFIYAQLHVKVVHENDSSCNLSQWAGEQALKGFLTHHQLYEPCLRGAHVSGDTSSAVFFTPSWDRKWWGRPRQSQGTASLCQEMMSASLISPVQI